MTHDDKFHKMQRQRVVDNFLPEDEFFAMQKQYVVISVFLGI